MASIWLIGTLAACLARAGQTEPAAKSAETVPPRPTATRAAVPPEDPWSSTEVAAPSMDDGVIRRPSGSKAPASSSGTAASRAQTWFRTSLSLAGVVVLIILLAWGYRLVARTGGRWPLGMRNRPAGMIEVLGRSALSARQTLYLVRVGPQLILIGGTHDSLRSLSVINDGELAARMAGRQAQSKADSHGAEFNSCLETEAQAYQAEQSSGSATESGAAERITDLRGKLAGIAGRLRGATAKP